MSYSHFPQPPGLIGKLNTRLETPMGEASVSASTNSTTFSAWVQLIASLPVDAIITKLTIAGTTAAEAAYLIEIGYGPSGSETPLAATRITNAVANGATSWWPIPLCPAPRVTAGSRIAVRSKTSNTYGSTAIDAFYCPISAVDGLG